MLSSADLRIVFENTTDGTFALEVGEEGELRYIAWNAACEAAVGLRAEAVLGKTPREALGDQIGAHFEARYRECVERREPRDYEEAVVVRGVREVSRTRLFPVEEGGSVVRIVGVSTNIGREVRSRRALQESEERYRALLDSLLEGVWAIDEGARTTFVNPSMATMLGYTVDEMLGRHLFSFMNEEGIAIATRNLERRAAGISEQHEFRLLRKDGKVLELLMAASPLRDAEGKHVGALAGVLDISSLREAERQRASLERKLLETQRLESLGLLAGGIAHDFNNILTVVLSLASLGRRQVPEGAGWLEGIEQAARRAADLCRQLLAYSGRGRFVIELLDVTALVRDATELLRLSIARTASFRVELASDPLVVSGDASQLRQILLNLVINASEAMTGPGTITVRTRCELVDERTRGLSHPLEPGPYVVLEVSDEGVGMTPEQLSRIFDPFYTTKFTGRGLGLSAVLGVTQGHGGAARVRSTPGKGTTFEIFLPRAAGVAARQQPPTQPGSWQGQGLMLLVDDEAMVRDSSASLLRQLGFEVLVAGDGLAGLELFERHAHELVGVLLDLTMPVMDGATAFRKMKLSNPRVPIVMVSGFDSEEAAKRLAGAAPDGVLEKPFDLEGLRDVLRSVLGGTAAAPGAGST